MILRAFFEIFRMKFLGSDHQPTILLNNHQMHKIDVDVHPCKKQTASLLLKIGRNCPMLSRFTGVSGVFFLS